MSIGNKRLIELSKRYNQLSNLERAEIVTLKEAGFGL